MFEIGGLFFVFLLNKTSGGCVSNGVHCCGVEGVTYCAAAPLLLTDPSGNTDVATVPDVLWVRPTFNSVIICATLNHMCHFV